VSEEWEERERRALYFIAESLTNISTFVATITPSRLGGEHMHLKNIEPDSNVYLLIKR